MNAGDPDATPGRLIGCHTCGLVSRCTARHGHSLRCPRCGARLHRRTPHSLSRSWAYLVAAMILYLPANLLPMMRATELGSTRSDTIVSGAEYLLVQGMWPLALVVFVASILVPVLKMLILAFLLVTAQRRSRWRPLDRTRLYRFTEFVGRWSMVDVFVVTILVALVNLGALAQVQAGPAAVYFAAVVILTMLSAKSFDPRLIWDAFEGMSHE